MTAEDDDPEDSPLARLAGPGQDRLRHRLSKTRRPDNADALRSELFVLYWRRPWAVRPHLGKSRNGFRRFPD